MKPFLVHRRALTLIEVLLAVVLLAMLTAIATGIIRDAQVAGQRESELPSIDEAAPVIDAALKDHASAIWELREGQAWSPPLDSGTNGEIRLTRIVCEDCPEGMGRLTCKTGGLSLTRFHSFKPEEYPE